MYNWLYCVVQWLLGITYEYEVLMKGISITGLDVLYDYVICTSLGSWEALFDYKIIISILESYTCYNIILIYLELFRNKFK